MNIDKLTQKQIVRAAIALTIWNALHADDKTPRKTELRNDDAATFMIAITEVSGAFRGARLCHIWQAMTTHADIDSMIEEWERIVKDGSIKIDAFITALEAGQPIRSEAKG